MARLAPYSIQWMAPPCASWGFLPRSHTGRSAEEPLGRVCRHTWGPNRLAHFVARALLCATALGIWVVLEQPVSSLLIQEPEVAAALLQIRARTVTVHLHGWGAPSLKPLWLIGTTPWLEDLARESRSRNRDMRRDVEPLAVRDEHGGVTGTTSVRGFEEYPQEFCDTWWTYTAACHFFGLFVRGGLINSISDSVQAASPKTFGVGPCLVSSWQTWRRL